MDRSAVRVRFLKEFPGIGHRGGTGGAPGARRAPRCWSHPSHPGTPRHSWSHTLSVVWLEAVDALYF